MAEPYRFLLDGSEVAVEADPKTSALDVLRDQLGVFTAKAGCSPQGLCGCCTALVEGKPRLTCTLPIKSLAGKSVTTIAGLPEEARARIAEAFVRTGAAQCGYCTPGIVLSTHALLTAEVSPTDEAIQRALNVHTCRCTGYTAIVDGIKAAAACAREEGFGCPALARPEGHDVVLGDRPYVDDLVRPGMLHGCVVFAPARGRVRTLALPDADGGECVLPLVSEGQLAAHAGVAVAAVAAADPARARALAAAVRCEVDAEPVEGAVLASTRTVEGDVDAAFAASVTVAEVSLAAAAVDAVPLEPEAALAVPADGGLVVYSAGHDAYAESARLGASLGVPVRVLLVPSGGSYGAKEAMLVQEPAARLALATQRPVRVALGHEEATRARRRRPGGSATARAGLDASGRLVALEVSVELQGGADAFGADVIAARAAGAIPFDAPAQRVEVRVRSGEGDATAPIRGVGLLAAAVAERAVAEAARRAGLDARQVRRASCPAEALPLFDALEADAEPDDAIALARADGAGGARVVLRVLSADEVEVQANVPELGQGRDASLLAALVTATGLPAEAFGVAWGDSAVVGAGASASAPIERAAAIAGARLAGAGGSLGALVGQSFEGIDTERADAGWCAARVRTDASGRVTSLRLAVAAGEVQDMRLVRNLAEGAAHMGVGAALTEEVPRKEGLSDARFRVLGVLKPRHTPSLRAEALRLGGGPREVSEAACCAAAAAVCVSVGARQPEAAARLPMKQSGAAAAAGVRPARGTEGASAAQDARGE